MLVMSPGTQVTSVPYNPLDGCVYVYLGNVEEFKDQVSSEEFHHWFPNLNNYCMQIQVCAVGWEPNPAATKYLKKLEASYQRCGFRVKINTETGVGIQNSDLKFVRMKQVS